MKSQAKHLLHALLILALLTTPALAAEKAAPGQNPWSQWKGMPQGKDFFPIGVWAQNPASAGKYKVTTGDGTTYDYDVRDDGTYTAVGSDGSNVTGTRTEAR